MNKQFIYSYLKKKNKALGSKKKEKEYRDELHKIKKQAIENIETLKEKAVENLEENGFEVHVVKSRDEAREKLKELIGDEKLVVKAKSNTVSRVFGFGDGTERFKSGDLNQQKWFFETDLGDFIAGICKRHDVHPVLPALSLDPKEIVRAIKKEFKVDIEPNAESIVAFAAKQIKEKIFKAKVGLTGVNVVTAEGNLVILENEGNISLVTRLPEKHIAVAGIEKIVSTLEDAMHVVKSASIWGTGQELAAYVNVISGPSKTSDIQNELVIGAQGAKESHVILIDDVTKYKEFKEALYCINCGACLNLCDAYHSSEPGDQYRGIKYLVEDFLDGVKEVDQIFACSTCRACQEICPAKIDLAKLMLRIREKMAKEGKVPKGNKKMMKNIKDYDNPFGKVDKVTPRQLYCC